MNRLLLVLLFLRSVIVASSVPSVTDSPWGDLPNGDRVTLYTLVNDAGMRADISDYGAIVVRLFVPDKDGKFDDVVLGYNTLAEYLRAPRYFGAVIGRYSNRIAHGRFELDGVKYQLSTNTQAAGVVSHLHGGKTGFDKVLWRAEPVWREKTPGLRLAYRSLEGSEGYPGNVDVVVQYFLENNGTLRVEFAATTDRATPISLTQHSYFNLKGEGRGDVMDHRAQLHSSRFLQIDAAGLPTGAIETVVGTPLDFLEPRSFGERIDSTHEQTGFGNGYDHYWIIESSGPSNLHPACVAFEPTSGRTLTVSTSEPGFQLYTGNFLDGSNVGKSGRAYLRRAGFAVETQRYPDAPNHRHFPDVILRPGETYRSQTLYRFSAQ